MATREPIAGNCGAKLTNGSGLYCSNAAGKGTDHVGYGACSKHGGSTRNGQKNGQKLMAKAMVTTYGLPVTGDPHRVLLEELWRTNGHVLWLRDKITAEGDDALTESTIAGKQPSVWAKLYMAERSHLAKVARDCVQSGVEERMVRVLEVTAEAFVAYGQAQLRALGVDPFSDDGRRAMDAGLAALPEGLVA
jgi:hypothetical protein